MKFSLKWGNSGHYYCTLKFISAAFWRSLNISYYPRSEAIPAVDVIPLELQFTIAANATSVNDVKLERSGTPFAKHVKLKELFSDVCE